MENNKTYFVDIDETICVSPPSRDYSLSKPIDENIKKINNLYDKGNTIVYWTARGTMTGIDWRSITEKQFQNWGVKYHELRFGKPVYDLFIDDKNIECNRFFDEEYYKILSTT